MIIRELRIYGILSCLTTLKPNCVVNNDNNNEGLKDFENGT
jgi:hypothetical protein